jgi:hypothetical protein
MIVAPSPIGTPSVLVALLHLVDRVPLPAPPPKRGRGRPVVYTDRLFLKALVVMLLRRLPNVHLLYTVVTQPTPEMAAVRAAMAEEGRLPCRRTFERRLERLPTTLPAQIGVLGRCVVTLVNPWHDCGRAVADDSTALRANGGVWHVKQRRQLLYPHTSIDPEADWTKSGWHGWIYGWKLHLVITVARVWIPLAATVTRANVHDGTPAPGLLREAPLDTAFVFGDRHLDTPEVRHACQTADRALVTPQPGPYPHRDARVEVRRICHRLRSTSCEPFHQVLKGLFELHGQVPTKGLLATKRFVLGAVFVYQLALWYRFEHGLPLQTGMKAFLKAAEHDHEDL